MWLDDDTVFAKTDIVARKELTQVLSKRIPQYSHQLLDLLAVAPLPLPFDLIKEVGEHPEIALDALDRFSLISREAVEDGRAGLVPLAREARVHELSEKRKDELESLLTTLYERWITSIQKFKDNAERAGLIAEMVVRYLRARQLLDAAELIIQFGWLCTTFGQVSRIQRVYEEVISADKGKGEDIQHEVGRLLLQHHIGTYTGNEITLAERDQIYLQIHNKVLLGEVTLQAHAELTVLFHTLLVYIN